MSAEQETARSFTPHQQSDLTAASESVYVEAVSQAVDETFGQTTGLDIAALFMLALVAALYHAVVPSLRDGTMVGAMLKPEPLRRAVTVVFILIGAMLVVGERSPNEKGDSKSQPLRMAAGVGLVLYMLYIALANFSTIDLAVTSALPSVLMGIALICVVLLWQPWQRVTLYRKMLGRLAPTLVIMALVLIVWEGVIDIFKIQRFLLPAPSVIAQTFFSVYPRLVAQGWMTFQNALWGYALGCGAGIIFGLLTARFGGFSKATLPYAIAVNSIPIIAFAPITNAWFGVTEPGSKIAIVAILTFFPAMINTVRGLSTPDSSSLELMRSLAASEFTVFRKVRLPSALPFIFNALKLATTLSMIGAIVAEYFGGPTTGLGVQISSNATLIRYPLVWSQIVIASLLGISFYFVVSLIERMVMPWHISFRNTTEG